MNPFRNLEFDLPRAIHEVFDEEYDPAIFNVKKNESVRVSWIKEKCEAGYSPFIESRSLVDASKEEIEKTLCTIKGSEWTKIALSWLKGGLPAVALVILSSEPELYLLADGHHRLALADAVGLEKIPAVFIKRVKPQK